MPSRESVGQYERLLNELFNVFLAKLKATIRAMSLEDRSKKVEAVRAAQTALDDLKRSISEADRPHWMGPLIGAFNTYLSSPPGSPDIGLNLFNTISQNQAAIDAQKWHITDNDSNSGVDFSAIYMEYFNQSRVPALFDELVKHLEEIIHSGQVDSVKMIRQFEELIATIKKNARRDYFSTRGAWEFTRVYLANLGIEALEEIPLLRVPIKALRKTAEELDIEMNQVTEQVSMRVTQIIHAPLPILAYKRLALPPPNEPEIIEGSSINP